MKTYEGKQFVLNTEKYSMAELNMKASCVSEKLPQVFGDPCLNNPYTQHQLQDLIERTTYEINKLSHLKGGEYAGDGDRLLNFKRNASNLGVPPEVVWSIYAAKHWDAIQQYCKDILNNKNRERLESIMGRADDLIVYLILFKALYENRGINAIK